MELLASGEADKAVAQLQARIRANAKDGEAYFLLCRTQYALERFEDAASSCRHAVEFQPANSLYYLWLGRSLGEQASRANFLTAGRLARQVRAAFERAVELNKQRIDARQDLAEYYIEAPAIMGGGKDKAAKLAADIQAYSPAAAEWIRARLAEKAGHAVDAENHYRAAIEAAKDSGTAWLDLAGFFRRQKRLDEMEKTITTAVAKDGKNPRVLFEGADMLHRAGRNFPAGISYLKRYLDAGKPSQEAPLFQVHHLMGVLLQKQGDRQGATEHFQAALKLASQYKPSQQALERLRN